MDITGRDQADQKLHLQFDQDTFLWNMTKAENKITAPPPDEVLEKISALLTVENPWWSGAASDLLPLLSEVDLQPNTLTRKLNVNVERLLNEYNIRYENSRTRQGSHIKLTLLDMPPCDDVTVI